MAMISGKGWQAEFVVKGEGGDFRTQRPLVCWVEEEGIVTGLIATGHGDLRPADSVAGFDGYSQACDEVVGMIPASGWRCGRPGEQVSSPVVGWVAFADGDAGAVTLTGDGPEIERLSDPIGGGPLHVWPVDGWKVDEEVDRRSRDGELTEPPR
jgi:hypothetical protein